MTHARHSLSSARLLTTRARLHVPLLLALAALAAAAPRAEAQASRPAETRILIDATGAHLWAAAVKPEQTTLFHRSATTPQFDLGRVLYGPVARLAATSDALYAFLENGNLYVTAPQSETPTVGLNLPRRATPLDAVGVERRLLAVVSSEIAAALPPPGAPASGPADPDPPLGDSAVCIVAHDGRAWRVISDGPTAIRSSDGPLRLGWAWDQPLLAWRNDAGLVVSRRLPGGGWSEPARLPITAPGDFWLLSVNGQPTALAVDAAGAPSSLQAARLLGRPDAEWTPLTLDFSPLPDAAVPVRISRAAAFNQHIVALVADGEGRPYLQFARPDGRSAEASVDLRSVAQLPGQVQTSRQLFELLTFLTLAGVLVGLFVFRRESMLVGATVPPGLTLAGPGARLLGFVIDLTPFTFAAAIAAGVTGTEALEAVALWVSETSGTFTPPRTELVIWWTLSAGGYCAYCTAMELITGRTVGKVLTGTRVLSERGRPAHAGQLLGRNAARLIELLPPFWIFGLLVLLSRNNQRLGDIFARTVVVRRAPPEPVRDKGSRAEKTDRPADPTDET